MAHVRDAAFHPSSPHSSSGDSYKHEATPETRLTIFSPDDGPARVNKMNVLGLGAAADHPANYHHVNNIEGFADHAATVEKDPFVSGATPLKGEQKLSPTASAFRPVSVPLVARGSLNAAPGMNAGLGANRQLFSPQGAARFSNELGVSRCIVFYSHSQPLTINDVEGYIAKLERLGSPCHGKRNVAAADGKVFLHLPNIRDARNAHDNVQLGSPDWCAEYIAATTFYNVCGSPDQADPICNGQIQIMAFAQGANMSAAHVETVVHTFLETQGEVFAIMRQNDSHDGAFHAVVEFSDADVAITVVHRFNGTTLGGVQLVLTLCQLDGAAAGLRPLEGHNPLFNALRSPIRNEGSIFQGLGALDSPQRQGIMAPGRFAPSPAGLHGPQQFAAMYPMVYHGVPAGGPSRYVLDQTPTRGQGIGHMAPMTPISGGIPVMGPLYSTTPPATPMAMHGDFNSPRSMQPYSRMDGRRQNAMRVNRSPYFNNAGHHNHVDVNRIRDGIDVRTTIMLRNIPNKVDQAMLKRIVDESSWGKYDFMYLRIDFANDCNVGYAFINFVDPLDIIDFVNARGNQRWNCFKSDKVAEISYATIQGKDCLVQKFRNSSVMLEAPHYRPKLYYTSNGPRPDLSGQEERFPEPDNQSKMKRSCENAEHVGLFTPNAGQHFRDEQRRRRSQYDRGTRLAALEEYDFDSRVQQQHPFFGSQ
ncbi:meiosis protein mei2 [Staphylotrichum tortipilum]|uniref:Meiosis protein mei2 n=1 Tax=Staphylotrichum tortipilum TaxID=2831512 RepID=A0AAN6RT82_9PEZI|nr:meiosis protein mei2 [Staphylotrichum longicolle]